MSGKAFNRVVMDEGAIMTELIDIMADYMTKSSDKVAKCFQKHFGFPTSGAPGDPKWRKGLQSYIKTQAVEISTSVIQAKYGFPDDLESSMKSVFMKAMVIMYGSGSQGLHASEYPDGMHMGPPGREVWTKEMARTISTRNFAYLPAGFNQKGNDALQQTINEVRNSLEQYFFDVFEEAAQEVVRRKIFARNTRAVRA